MTSKLIVQKCDITTKDILEILNYVILFKWHGTQCLQSDQPKTVLYYF